MGRVRSLLRAFYLSGSSVRAKLTAMGLLDGKKGLILSIANDRSIAWHIGANAIEQGALSPDVAARNLWDSRPSYQQVRRAVIDGRPGMPKGLLGGDDVDAIAAYVIARTRR